MSETTSQSVLDLAFNLYGNEHESGEKYLSSDRAIESKADELSDRLVPFFQHPVFEKLLSRVLIKKQDRILFFGDITHHDEWKNYEILFMVTPVLLTEDGLKHFENELLENLMQELLNGSYVSSDEMDPVRVSLVAWAHSFREGLRESLAKLIHRNLTRNMVALKSYSFIDPVQATQQGLENARQALAKEIRDNLLKPEHEAIDVARAQIDAALDNLAEIRVRIASLVEAGIEDDGSSGDRLLEECAAMSQVQAVIVNAQQRTHDAQESIKEIEARAEREAWKRVQDAWHPLPPDWPLKYSFNSIIAAVAEIESMRATREEKSVECMRRLVAIPGMTDRDLLELDGRSLGNAKIRLKSLSDEFGATLSMFRSLVPEIPLPSDVDGKPLDPPSLDLLKEVEGMRTYELLLELRRLHTILKPTDEDVRRAHEILLLLTFAKNANWAFVDPAYNEAKGLNGHHGDTFNEQIKPLNDQHSVKVIYSDPRGNYFLDKADLPDFVDPKSLTEEPIEMRHYLVEVNGGVRIVRVYLPFLSSDVKERGSIEEKTLRQYGDKPYELYDLHRNLVIYDMTLEEMCTEEGKAIVEAITVARMKGLSIEEQLPSDAPRKKIGPGKFKIDYSKLKSNPDNKNSKGLLVAKPYYRTNARNGNVRGVGGEEQHMAIDMWVNYKSKDHILNERFYRVEKLIQIARDYVSQSAFPRFFAYAEYFRKCLNAIEDRASKNNGWVYGARVNHPITPYEYEIDDGVDFPLSTTLEPLSDDGLDEDTDPVLDSLGSGIEDEVTD